ncbi:Ig-like domain-containing protein [Butyrivibrio sp. AE3009]|uniref:Ig-like domain-containing protein n=1 Tax=Butyrivibrio sp. AE3009 TaxID=1280666 RepID=UPI0003B6FE69|nr:Ig-like domain-containing protein [Butyrivibrio sp. AE3009]
MSLRKLKNTIAAFVLATAFLTQSVGAAAAGECTGYDLTDSQDYWEIEDISEDASEEASDGTQENISVAEDDEIIIDETNEPDSEELGSENYAVDSSYENNDEQICEDEEWNDPESEEYVIGDDEVYDEQEELTYEETEDISGNDLTQEDIFANDSAEDISGNDVTGDSYALSEMDVQAGSEKKINSIELHSNIDKSSDKSKIYGIKYGKNEIIKSGVVTLNTAYTSMKLNAIQRSKDGSEIKVTPTWKSSNEKVVAVSASGLNATIKAVGVGKATIICTAGDGSKKTAKVVITVKQGVTDLEITGQTYIAAGKNASYKTIAYPKKASNKKVTWSLKKDIPGVSVNPSSGKVSVTKDVAKETKVVIIATAKDCSGVYTEKEITVRERATKVTLSTPSTTTIATHAVGDLKDSVSFEASTDNDETVSWKVSNDKIANLSIKGNKATLTALAAGNVTVTAFANDGSGKKATAKIKMVIPVSDLSLSVPIDRQDDKLASGGSLKFTPVIGNKYGKPSNSKIRWEYEIVGYKDKGQTSVGVISDATMAKILKKKYLFTFSNGKITAVSQKKYDKQAVDLRFDCECNNYGIKVTAYTTDGSNLHSETKLVKRVDCNTYMKLSRGNTYEVLVGKDYPYTCMLLSENRQNKLYIVNKNEDIATLTVNEKDYVHIHGKKKGTTTVTIKAMDGSGLSVKVTIKVI